MKAERSSHTQRYISTIKSGHNTIFRVFRHLISRGLGRLIPFAVLMFLVALVLMLLSSSSPLAPFIYPLL